MKWGATLAALKVVAQQKTKSSAAEYDLFESFSLDLLPTQQLVL
jgi:hypothetical protein